jgi:hypothetical protein
MGPYTAVRRVELASATSNAAPVDGLAMLVEDGDVELHEINAGAEDGSCGRRLLRHADPAKARGRRHKANVI